MIWFEMSCNKYKIPILEKKEKVQEIDEKEEENEHYRRYLFREKERENSDE